jgi:patatin-like phospholipase/acyl hydrolase
MLALDGGGIRGVMTLGILKGIEDQVGSPLCNYFDYIAGTSTGAIIAAGLARGMTVAQLLDFYRKN